MKLITFVPIAYAEKLREALWAVGAGHIGNYSECSFNSGGQGTFRGGADTDPFVGQRGKLHTEEELKIEVVFPSWLQKQVISALIASHPYEEPAYDIVVLDNYFDRVGSGLTGIMPESVDEGKFLETLKKIFKLSVVRHTRLMNKKIKTVSLCGGAGSFLIPNALQANSDIYITADIKYHEFFDAEGRMVIADIGHFESEQFTIDLMHDILQEKFPTFAVLKTAVNTNPVFYYA